MYVGLVVILVMAIVYIHLKITLFVQIMLTRHMVTVAVEAEKPNG